MDYKGMASKWNHIQIKGMTFLLRVNQFDWTAVTRLFQYTFCLEHWFKSNAVDTQKNDTLINIKCGNDQGEMIPI